MKQKYLRQAAVGIAALLFATAGFAADQEQGQTINMFGGPAYLGAPNLELTAALVKAGGGPEHFSTVKALTSMLGAKTVNAEVAKLTKQYGSESVHNWLAGTDAVVTDALKHATKMGIKLPKAPAKLHGQTLAVALVKAGTGPDGTYWSGRCYDVLVSHGIHNAVMDDVNANPKLGMDFDQNVHKITNQAFYDVAHALGHKQVKLASLH
ncbi:MAG TPA: hypothetical protein VFH85_09000 [Gammaproteobacteria bacterium]|nr:hypothetical protein [Gammaproteobacteria bacterium]